MHVFVHEGTPALRAAVVPVPGGTAVEFCGEVDLANRAWFELTLEHLCRRHGHVRVDVSRLGFCDVGGARVLYLAQQRAVSAAGSVTVTGAGGAFRRLVTVCRFDALLNP